MDENLPQRLVKARSGHGWSQADLSEVSGVAAAQISRYEAGRSRPRMEVVAKLAKAMGVNFDWLAYGKGLAEGGHEVPQYPGSQHFMDVVELNAEEHRKISEYARENGLTVEMAVKQLALIGMELLKNEQSEGKSPKP